MTLIIPASVKNYYEDEKVRSSVDALLQNLDGAETFENIDRNESRSYNLALLAAAQVRADYVEFLFSLWEDTFGKALQNEGVGLVEKFYGDDGSAPAKVWENGYISSLAYGKGGANEGSIFYELTAWGADDKNIILSAHKWNEEKGEYVDFDIKLTEDIYNLWVVEKSEDNGSYLSSTVPFTEFIADPDAQLSRLRGAAEVLIRNLSSIA